jgi:hypothetical protein
MLHCMSDVQHSYSGGSAQTQAGCTVVLQSAAECQKHALQRTNQEIRDIHVDVQTIGYICVHGV